MKGILYFAAWTEEPELPTIEASDLTPGAMEKLIESMLPGLQTLIFNIVISILIFVIGKKLISVILKILERFLARTSVDEGISKFLLSAAKYLLYLFLVIMIVGQLGLNTASIVTVLGTAGLAVGMSLQGSLSNVAGGILILLMKPFKVGDFISTSFGDGTVKVIGLVYTTITTPDNRVLTVPNGTLSNSAVTDASMMPERRLDVSVGISYDADLLKAKEIMEEVYLSCPALIADKGVNVHVSSLADSAVILEAFGWVPGSDYLSSKWYVTEQIKLRFDAGGVQIPYPQMDVHLDTGAESLKLPASGGKL